MRVTIVLTMALTLGGCLHWPGPTGSPRVMKLFGGQAGYELVRIPALARVEVNLGPEGSGSGPYRLADADLKRFSDLLCDESSYAEGLATTRGTYRRDAAVQFAGRANVVLVFSYETGEVRTSDGVRPIGSAMMTPARVDEVKRMLEALRTAPID